MKATPDDIGRLVLEVFRVNGCLIAAGDKLVAQFGLSSARWQVLGAALRSEHLQTVSQIARETGVSRQAVQRIANALVNDGLLKFNENEKDKRAPLVDVTEAGHHAYSEADRVRQAWLENLTLTIETCEIDQAVMLLRGVRTKLSGS